METNKNKYIPDTDFVQGKWTESFRFDIINGFTNKEYHFLIEKEGEKSRTYRPVYFLETVLESYCLAADKTNKMNEKLMCMYNAKSNIKEYIRQYKLTQKGFDFSEVFDRLNDNIECFEKNIALKINNKKVVKKTVAARDVRYLIEDYEIFEEFDITKRQIKVNGFLNFHKGNKEFKVYTPQLAIVLMLNKLPAINLETKTTETLNRKAYFNTYTKAYNKGLKYFETHFSITPNNLYGAKGEEYIRNLHMNYYHSENHGWQIAKDSYSDVITHRSISEYGFNAGLITQVVDLIKRHPKLFKGFDNCDHENNPPLIENKAEQIKLNYVEYNSAINDIKSENEKINSYSLKDIFIVEDWEKYLNALTICEPQLLTKENGKYRFIGNKKIHRGCLAQWIKYLKNKCVIDQTLNRNDLAFVLSKEILDFKINGSSIDNQSEIYKIKFEDQLKRIIK